MENSKDYERSQASRQENRGVFITRVRNKLGNIEATRQGIAYVFKLYKDLYSSSNDETKDKLSSEDRPHFLEDQVVLQSLRKTPRPLFVPEVSVHQCHSVTVCGVEHICGIISLTSRLLGQRRTRSCLSILRHPADVP